MKSTLTSVAFSAGLALAVAGCAAGVDNSTQEARSTAPTTDQDQQQHIATTTLALEKAYDVQYVKGQVDADALQPLIYDVLQSMPEDMRPKAQAHIYDVISRGQKDATEKTPEQRAKIATAASADKVGPQQVDLIGAWGWPAYGYGGLGFGGLGFGVGYGAAYGTAYSTAYVSPGVYGGFGYPVGFGAYAPYGLGYGCAGLYGLGYGYPGTYLGWGGLGAFGWPGFYGGLGLGLGVGVPGGFGF